MNINVAIIVPCYNEEKRLDINAFSRFIQTHQEIVFYMVDDGSKDQTAKILSNLELQYPHNCRAIILEKNQGKAEAVRQGLICACEMQADIEYVGFWDADLATPLDDILSFKKYLLDHSATHMVMGCRLRRLGATVERKMMRHYLGRIFATTISIYLNLPTYDTQCGAKLFKKEFILPALLRPFNSTWFFDVEILKRLQKKYGRKMMFSAIYEYPLMQWVDVGESKVKLHKALWQFFKLILSK